MSNSSKKLLFVPLAAALVAAFVVVVLATRVERAALPAEGSGVNEGADDIRNALAPADKPGTLLSGRESGKGSVESSLVSVSLVGEVLVEGKLTSQRFGELQITVIAASGKAIRVQAGNDGRFQAALTLTEDVCAKPLSVTLDEGSRGKRLTQSVQLHKVAAPSGEGPEYAGRVAFSLEERCVIRGTVVEPEGPLGGADVALIQLSSMDESYQVLVEAKSGPDGSFSLDAPRQDGLLVAVVERTHQPAARFVSTASGGQTDLGAISVQRGEVIEGRVVWNEAEKARGGFEVSATRVPKRVILLGAGADSFFLSLDGETLSHYAVFVSVKGDRFTLPGLEAGEYVIQLDLRDGFCALPGLPDVAQKVQAPADIVLDAEAPEAWFEVVAADTQRPVFAALRITGLFGELACHTDRKGVACVFTVPEADYQAFIEAPGYKPAKLDLRAAPLNGFVTQVVRLIPEPTGSMEVVLDRTWRGRARFVLTLQGDGAPPVTQDVDIVEGRFRLDSLRPGFYEASLDLWGAGELNGGAADDSVHLTFSARIAPGGTTEQRLVVR